MDITGDSAEFFRVVEIPYALGIMQKHTPVPKLGSESCRLEDSLGRFLAADIVSPEKVPAFDRSSVDGYAVRAQDTFGASEGNPAYLKVVGQVRMGEATKAAVGPGEAVAIPTGGMLPPGADAVLMVEYTAMLDDATVEAVKAVGPGDRVVRAGEDISEGETLLGKGHRLRAQDLGALAALGISRAPVYLPLQVGILSTGDEIVGVDDQPGPGQVRDVNYYALAASVRQSGAEPVNMGICPDDAAALRERFNAGVRECHILLTSGGSSVGVADLTPQVINSLGEPGVLVHGVAVKPGKPTLMAVVDGIPVFGLPGHPVSALDIYRLLVDPLIQYLYGGEAARDKIRPRTLARLGRSLASVAGREDRVRVILETRDGELWAQPVLGKSGLISLMVRSSGVAVIPFEAEGVNRGDKVTVELF